MTAINDKSLSQNNLLRQIEIKERRDFINMFEFFTLKLGDTLIKSLAPLTHVYFVLSGLVSVLATDGETRDSEVGVYGFEGMGSTASVLGSDRCHYKHMVQVEGEALRIECALLLAAMEKSPSLSALLHKYVHAFNAMTAYTAVSNAHYRLDQRLARWLLMSQDRIRTPGIALTHDFLSRMLNVRRPSVTDAINTLEGFHCIRARRGYVEITDREALKKRAGRTYGMAEAEYRRLIGGPEIFT